MGVFYPCWSTGHSDKTAKIFQSPPIPFAVTFNGKVYASEGKNQYWDWEQYDYFNGCSSTEGVRQTKEMQMNNKEIISRLFPVLKEAIENMPSKTEFEPDYYEHPHVVKHSGKILICCTDYQEAIIIEATMPFQKGKYSHATVSAKLKDGKITYGYSKEFKVMGNGYYADLDDTGSIIRAEWD